VKKCDFCGLKSAPMPTEGRMFLSVSLIDRQAKVSRSFQSDFFLSSDLWFPWLRPWEGRFGTMCWCI